ncbi:hypothetical protein Tco_0314822, partial [Tanacetum coccineum]
MNHVAYHRSLDLRKQFKVLAKYADMPSLRWKPKKIRHREFKGSSNQDFISIYNKEYDLWNEAKRAEMYIKTPPDAPQSPPIQMEGFYRTAKKYKNDVIENMHRLPVLGYENLSKSIGVPQDVIELC